MHKILIAEDDRVAQRLVVSIVESMGYTAFVSPNGKHAYDALLAENKFEILITDIMMPKMDGRELIQTLRGNTAFQQLPIIIMSAVVGIEDISGLLKLGATRFLAKPLDKAELEEALKSCKIAATT